MQTFLPLPDFQATAEVLDYRRLGKQRVEAFQVLKALRGESRGWVNHPAVLMWAGYEGALCEYGRIVCAEWRDRGYVDNMYDRFPVLPIVEPPWLGDMRLHISHQANLVRKLPEHYRLYFPDVDETMPYYWVSNEKEYNG
jgi:hypothetical protein